MFRIRRIRIIFLDPDPYQKLAGSGIRNPDPYKIIRIQVKVSPGSGSVTNFFHILDADLPQWTSGILKNILVKLYKKITQILFNLADDAFGSLSHLIEWLKCRTR